MFLGVFIGIAVGSLVGYVLFQWACDRIDQKMERRGKAIAQYRQLPLVLSSLIISYGVSWFGWSAGRAKHIISPLVATLLASLGSSLTVLMIEAYLIDVFVRDLSDAIAAINFLGSLIGGLLPLVGLALYVSPLGIEWTYTLFGIVALVTLERTWYLWREGKRLDKNPTRRWREVHLEDVDEIELRDLSSS